jgi:hypothetical protein
MATNQTTQQPAKLSELLPLIKLGAGIAEQDDLLWTCTVKTPHFMGLWRDEIDLITGSKGSGKSSLFRMFGELFVNEFRNKRNTLIVTGVETRGEPIFQRYAERFQKFEEGQFEIFWKLYILGLIYHRILSEEKLFAKKDALLEFEEFKTYYRDLKLLDAGVITSPTKLLKIVCDFTLAVVEGVKVSWDIEKSTVVNAEFSIREKMAERYKEIVTPDPRKLDTVLCVEALFALMQKSDIRLWVMLDHLDIVFMRRSEEEGRALRALLKLAQVFSSPHVRLKIFLRDDILDAITADNGKPLAGLSHAAGRPAPALGWTEDSLCVLIMKRLATNNWLKVRFKIDVTRLDSVEYARQCFHDIFRLKYKTQSGFDWIFALLSDGRGVVTPRDLIDMLKFALSIQSEWLQKHPDENAFMSVQSVQEAHRQLSISRRQTVLQAEFPHLMRYITQLEHKDEWYEKAELEKLFGEDASAIIAKLKSVGVLKYDGKKARYWVAKLYGPGLYVTGRISRSRNGNGDSLPLGLPS